MTIRWPLSKLALMIVVAIRVITWDDTPLQDYRMAPLPSSCSCDLVIMSAGSGEFQ